MLPPFLTPNRHYTEGVINSVLSDDAASAVDDYEESPSDQTVKRWHIWLKANEANINGYLKSIAHRELGYTMELLASGVSLLSHLKSSIPGGWLQTVLRYIYNSGNSLQAVY